MKLEAKQNDRVDFLVWANTGRDKGLVEAVVEANPGLYKVMMDLPIGYTFEIPDELLREQVKTVKRLW